MRNKGMLVRTFFALSLILALGVAPGFMVQAQQAAQKQPAPRAEVAAVNSANASEAATTAAEEKGQQLSADGEPLPLSDAEMEKVEGGFKFPSIKIPVPHIHFNLNLYIGSHNGNRSGCR